MRVVATAGHVDHGKSTLVRALTGTDPDRLAEEKARGLTIELGFAWARLPGGEVAFVDVPGHARFIRAMVAGVGAVDACLFVVDAGEGWMPQSEEHLRVLELMGVRSGVVALTKVASVGAGRLREARDEVAARLAATFLDGAPVVAVDVPAGRGLGALRTAVGGLAAGAGPAADGSPGDRPRLWVDRSFVVAGAGTVVTGTLTGGGLRRGDGLDVVPGGGRVRARGLQALGLPREAVGPGSRVAVNLAGAAVADAPRGCALVRAEQWRPSRTVDASLHVLAGLGHAVTARGCYALHVGTAVHRVRVRLLGAPELRPGATGHVRLHLPVALPLVRGDRYVLREDGRAETVGGGEVLDVAPVLPAARAAPAPDVDRLVAERGWVDADDLAAMTGERRAPTAGRWVVAPAALASTAASLRAALAAAGPDGVEVAALDDRAQAVLATLGDVTVAAGRAFAAGAGPGREPDHPWLARLDAEPFMPPPPPADLGPAELARLARRGAVVRLDGVWFAASAPDRAALVVARLLADHPAGVTASQARVALGTSRRFALPLLGRLDATGVTRRDGDVRRAGPRLPAPPQA